MEIVINTLWTKVDEEYKILGYELVVNGKTHAIYEDPTDLADALTQLRDEEIASTAPKR